MRGHVLAWKVFSLCVVAATNAKEQSCRAKNDVECSQRIALDSLEDHWIDKQKLFFIESSGTTSTTMCKI